MDETSDKTHRYSVYKLLCISHDKDIPYLIKVLFSNSDLCLESKVSELSRLRCTLKLTGTNILKSTIIDHLFHNLYYL